MKIGISACLLGDKVRFDGKDKRNEKLIKLLKNHEIIKICPEIESGFPIPHLPIELKNNKAYTKDNKDVTKQLIKGSNKTYQIIKDCDLIILKTKSPSCGYQKIYDGSFTNKLIKGNGIFTQICIDNNKKIYTDEDIDLLTKLLK